MSYRGHRETKKNSAENNTVKIKSKNSCASSCRLAKK